MKRFIGVVTLVLLLSGMALDTLRAQTPATATASADSSKLLSLKELDKLVGRIALYPDELIAIVLPASTYPLQIVQAARFLKKKKKNPKLSPRKDWDTSVLGLLNYPQVVETMDDDLDWTWKLGEAVVAQQKDVMNAIQQVRARAYAAGNLKSNDKQVIVLEKQTIIIKSPDPNVIYVPQYDPAVIVVQQSAPVTIVYSNPYPVYYSPVAPFFVGMFVGAAVSYGMNWHGHSIHYGHHGDVNINRNVNINRPGTRPGGGQTWRPGSGSGARPGRRPGTRPGSRPGTRPSTRPTRQANRGTRQGTRPNTRTGTRRSSPARASRGSSRSGIFGGYGRGYSARQNSQRGRQSLSSSRSRWGGRSRSSRSRGRSFGGRGRGGGGRGGRGRR